MMPNRSHQTAVTSLALLPAIAIAFLLSAPAPCTADDFHWSAPWADGEKPAPPATPTRSWTDAHPLSTPRTYSGDHLEYVLMPIGGIGTGTIWLDGHGRLAVWQIFNNYDERTIDGTFFAIRAKPQRQKAVTRVLQTTPAAGLQPMASLEYEGGYPIARLKFSDPDLPVNVALEAFNPLIPTDAANSALPCAIFRVNVTNTADMPVDVDFLGRLTNALKPALQVGMLPPARRVSRSIADAGFKGVAMEYNSRPLRSGRVFIRPRDPRHGNKSQVLWLRRLTAPSAISGAGQRHDQLLDQFARAAIEGGAVVAAGADPAFFKSLDAVKQLDNWHSFTRIFEDFEGDDYDGWTIEGDGFGDAPSHGTHDGQQKVSGFAGSGLVNTFLMNDKPQGTIVSDAFKIRSPWIGFLIGGGSHDGKTCLNLLMDDRIVRTATGKNNEHLTLQAWDVSDLMGKTARFQIVDKHSGGWGHINIDHIFFSDTKPEAVSDTKSAYRTLADRLDWPTNAAVTANAPDGPRARPDPDGPLADMQKPWPIDTYTRIPGLQDLAPPYEIIARTPSGDPLIITGPVGEASAAICLASDPPWEWVQKLIGQVTGKPIGRQRRLVPSANAFGSMALSSPDTDEVRTFPTADSDAILKNFAEGDEIDGNAASGTAADAVAIESRTMQPGQTETATLAITWHFPIVEHIGGHFGNLYNRAFDSAGDVARYVCKNMDALWGATSLYHTSVYQSNLPQEIIDAATSQSVIVRGPTTWWAEDGYFGAFEGCYTCCPLNCTHVWNYAQTHARLFPTIGKNMRQSDLLVYLHESGETSHRQHSPHGAFIDGQAATILGTYREHQLSTDNTFLKSVWPQLKKATNWLIQKIDADEDGVPAGHQLNTYDCAVSGANTFIGSQYLAALAAAEQMAKIMQDNAAAERWAAIRRAGMKNQNKRLWNDEFGYYIQKPGDKPARDYNTGCHSDQLLGQWWAHQLNLGYLYPPQRVKSALSAIVRHNFKQNFHGFNQRPRKFVADDDSGLLMCTWPHGGRPKPNIIYADEVWTGIEYSAAGAMIHEGMIDDARKIVKAARNRYDGIRREGLNSGPGGNPFCELECGKFYARAMSSWGMLIAAQGLVLDGPAGIIGFKPNWQPANHRSFFTAPQGWGLFAQSRTDNSQTEKIEVRYGKLQVRELVFELAAGVEDISCGVHIGGEAADAKIDANGQEVRIELQRRITVPAGQAIAVECNWPE